MNEVTLIKQATASLNYPKSNGDFIIFAQKIAVSMTNNPYFEASAPLVTRLIAHTKKLDDLETECAANPLTTKTKARNAARLTVENDLRALRLDVQKVANDDLFNAATIITSAGMSVKNYAIHGKQQNTAEDGVEEGTVDLTAEGAGPHEWRKSTDEKEWTPLPASRTSKTTAKDLISGVLYSFQNRMMLTNDEKTEWSQSVKIRVR